MAHESQLDIRQLGPNLFQLEFPYNEDFIAFLKERVPWRERSYDEGTRIWTIRNEKYMSPLESVGLQKFLHVMRSYRKGTGTVYRNVRTCTETVQEGLF